MSARGLGAVALAAASLAALASQSGCASAPRADVASVASQGRVSGPVALALARALEVEWGGPLAAGVVPGRLEELRATLARSAAAEGGGAIHLCATHAPRLHALPRGRIVVSRGLLAALAERDPSQPRIVAALAHEVAYASFGYPQAELLEEVRARGHERLGAAIAPLVSGSVSLNDVASLGAAHAALLAPRSAGTAQLARRAAADRLAVRLLARLGYPPGALERAWTRLATLERDDPAALAPLRASHGSCLLRASVARAAAKELGRLPARRDSPLELDLVALLRADRSYALLEALTPLARAGREADLTRAIGEGPARLRAEADWLQLLARHQALARQAEPPEGAALALEAELRRLLLRDPQHFGARLLLAERYLAAERLESARDEFQRLVLRSPLDARAQLGLARSLQAAPELARPRAEIAQALDDPGGRVHEAARRFLAGEGQGALAAPDPDRPRAERRLLGGGR